MAGKPKVRLESRFPAAKAAAHALVRHSRDLALNAGEAEAEKRLERIDDTRGYDLPIDVEQETIGHQSGRIYYEPWYGRFFEYGTVRISAAPFMRPAHRRMRKVFIEEMGGNFQGWLSRRAFARRW
jgi:HK97 gp10 family phage protein